MVNKKLQKALDLRLPQMYNLDMVKEVVKAEVWDVISFNCPLTDNPGQERAGFIVADAGPGRFLVRTPLTKETSVHIFIDQKDIVENLERKV